MVHELLMIKGASEQVDNDLSRRLKFGKTKRRDARAAWRSVGNVYTQKTPKLHLFTFPLHPIAEHRKHRRLIICRVYRSKSTMCTSVLQSSSSTILQVVRALGALSSAAFVKHSFGLLLQLETTRNAELVKTICKAAPPLNEAQGSPCQRSSSWTKHETLRRYQ